MGWYSTGPKIRPNDIDINELLRKYTPNPVLCVIEVKSTGLGLPTKVRLGVVSGCLGVFFVLTGQLWQAYVSVEKVNPDGTTSMSFKHVESQIGAVEAEEVGVEHLLRDVHDTSVSTLAVQVQQKVNSLQSLVEKLQEVDDYLAHVSARHLPPNQGEEVCVEVCVSCMVLTPWWPVLLGQLQNVFNLLPNLNTREMVEAFAAKSNDAALTIFLASLVRSIVALHDLINNRLANREYERKAFAVPEEAVPK